MATATITVHALLDSIVLESLIVKDEDTNLVTMETANTFRMPASDVNVDASFREAPVTPVEYNVRINPMTNGTVTADKAQAAGGEPVKLTVTPDTGYVLDTIQVLPGMGAEVALNADYSFTMPGEEVVVNASFREAPAFSHTVSFDANGGSAVSAQTIAEGETVTKPADPIRSGYTFEGWYTEAGCTNAFDFETPVTGGITLFARWTKAEDGKVTDSNTEADDDEPEKPSHRSGSGGRGGSSSVGRGASTRVPGGSWKRDATGWWYQYNNGGYPKNEWKLLPWNVSSAWYFFDEAGYMKTGWILSGEKWYYLSEAPDGTLGAMKTGWFLDPSDGFWYYLNPGDGAMRSGWQQIDGRWYYLNEGKTRPRGAMYRNEKTPDGYTVDESGAWVK